jgi:hypothetical protein
VNLSQEYNDSSSSNDESYYDDVLQRVLSLLAELPDILLNDIQRFLSGDCINNDSSEPSDRFAFASDFLRYMAVVLDGHEKPFLSSKYSSVTDIWKTGLMLVSKISKRIPGCALHVSASTSYYFSDDSKEVNDNRCHVFPILCILLSCRALQTLMSSQGCPSWKRSQSLLYETLRLHDQFQKSHESLLPFTVALWCHHVLPVTSTWHNFLWLRFHCCPTPLWRWYMAYEAVAVACPVTLSFFTSSRRNTS